MKAAFEKSSPVPYPPPESSAKLIGVLPGADDISANCKLVADLKQNAADNVVVWSGLCKQHASGLVTAPAVKNLKIASPAFCTCNLMKKHKLLTDTMGAMRKVIAQGDFDWIKALLRCIMTSEYRFRAVIRFSCVQGS